MMMIYWLLLNIPAVSYNGTIAATAAFVVDLTVVVEKIRRILVLVIWGDIIVRV